MIQGTSIPGWVCEDGRGQGALRQAQLEFAYSHISGVVHAVIYLPVNVLLRSMLLRLSFLIFGWTRYCIIIAFLLQSLHQRHMQGHWAGTLWTKPSHTTIHHWKPTNQSQGFEKRIECKLLTSFSWILCSEYLWYFILMDVPTHTTACNE